MGQRADVFEPGYDGGVELFVHCMGGSRLPRTNHSHRLESSCSSQQYGTVVDDSTGAAASATGDTRGSGGGIAGRPRLC